MLIFMNDECMLDVNNAWCNLMDKGGFQVGVYARYLERKDGICEVQSYSNDA